MGTFIVIGFAILVFSCWIVRNMIEFYQSKGLIDSTHLILTGQYQNSTSVHFWTVVLILIIFAVIAIVYYRKKRKNG